MDNSDCSDDRESNFQTSVVDLSFTPGRFSAGPSLDDTIGLLNVSTTAFELEASTDDMSKDLILQEKIKMFDSCLADLTARRDELNSRCRSRRDEHLHSSGGQVGVPEVWSLRDIRADLEADQLVGKRDQSLLRQTRARETVRQEAERPQGSYQVLSGVRPVQPGLLGQEGDRALPQQRAETEQGGGSEENRLRCFDPCG